MLFPSVIVGLLTLLGASATRSMAQPEQTSKKLKKLAHSYTDTRFWTKRGPRTAPQIEPATIDQERQYQKRLAEWQETITSRKNHEHMLKQMVTEAARQQRSSPPGSLFGTDLRDPASEQHLLSWITYAMTTEDQVDRYPEILQRLSNLGLYLPPALRRGPLPIL